MAAAREPHPWLLPLHRRIAVLGLALAWLAFEGWTEPLSTWFWIAAAMVAYGLWDFFLSGTYPVSKRP